MAIYYLGVKSFGRSAGTGGSISTSAAAYRAGERIRDERTNHVFDHSHRRDIEYKEILLPSHLEGAGSQLDWARNRSALWNAVERSEPRANARVAREYVLALPHELKVEQRVLLARGFARELSDRYHNAVDLALHQPRTDPRNFHAHLLATTREVNVHGLGPKTIAELNGSQRFEMGLPRAMQEHAQIRARWADLTNTALRDAGLDVRVSHIPHSESILRPEARPWLPRVAWEIERRGGHSVLGDRAREEFEQRREVVDEWRNGARRSPEEVRRRAIEEWRAIRAESSAAAPETAIQGPKASGLSGEVDRQVGSLRRELGRDDFGL
jgi:MobA/MobL family